jgi:hypothetical protein
MFRRDGRQSDGGSVSSGSSGDAPGRWDRVGFASGGDDSSAGARPRAEWRSRALRARRAGAGASSEAAGFADGGSSAAAVALAVVVAAGGAVAGGIGEGPAADGAVGGVGVSDGAAVLGKGATAGPVAAGAPSGAGRAVRTAAGAWSSAGRLPRSCVQPSHPAPTTANPPAIAMSRPERLGRKSPMRSVRGSEP